MSLFCSANNATTPNNHLPGIVYFQRNGQEVICPSPTSHCSEKYGSGYGAWHIVCLSQKSLTAAPVSFCPPSIHTLCSFIPAGSAPQADIAWHFSLQHTALHKSHAIPLAICRMATSFLAFQTDKSTPAALVCARPRSHRLRYRFCFTRQRSFAMPTQNPALCKYRIPSSCLAIYPNLVALAAKTLILRSFRFQASRTVIAI